MQQNLDKDEQCASLLIGAIISPLTEKINRITKR